MKFTNSFIIMLLSLISMGGNAQSIINPWSFSFGINAIDTRVSAGGNVNLIDDRFSQPFNVSQNWNIFPSAYLGLDRAISRDVSFGLEASFNKISKFVTFNGSNYIATNPGDLKYYGLDANLKYSLKSLLDSKVVDPNFIIGGGYAIMGTRSVTSVNAGFKLNLWISKIVAVSLGTMFKMASISGKLRQTDLNTPVSPDLFQHSIGLTYRFGNPDSDEDGVSDKIDTCPSVKGSSKFKGCPDSDGDGVKDSEDKCPNVKGLSSLGGCPDSDEDGIEDVKDHCPEEKGLKNLNGCPDRDKDGIADKTDKCPSEKGPKENAGCPWTDADKDTVLDKDDKCPFVAGPPSNEGCPEKKIVTTDVVKKLNEFAKTILFNSGKATFLAQTIPVLESMTAILKEYPDAKFSIEGHTDSDGSADNNLLLSKTRASAVKVFLIQAGIEAGRLTSVGHGESKPIASNKTAAGKALNRRTEVLLVN